MRDILEFFIFRKLFHSPINRCLCFVKPLFSDVLYYAVHKACNFRNPVSCLFYFQPLLKNPFKGFLFHFFSCQLKPLAFPFSFHLNLGPLCLSHLHKHNFFFFLFHILLHCLYIGFSLADHWAGRVNILYFLELDYAGGIIACPVIFHCLIKYASHVLFFFQRLFSIQLFLNLFP